MLLLSPRPSLCVMLPVGGNCLGPKTNGLCHTLHWVHWKWSSVRKRVGRRSRPSCSQRTDWEKVPHIVWAKDARGSLAHTVAHGAASQQRLQHAVAQARSSASLFWWVIDVGRRTDILHRFRLQWRSEAWSCGSLRTTIERSLDVNHREGRRQPPGLYRGSAATDKRHGDSLSETSWFLDGLMFG